MPTEAVSNLNLDSIRSQFPALSQTVKGKPTVFLDGPGGTQVPRQVIARISGYLRRNNANTRGAYRTSRATDRMIQAAREAMAEFLGCDADEIVFGPNMTSLTFAMSAALGRELRAGEEIVLTSLDHDANISPWRALEERGATIRMVDIREEDCTLDGNDLEQKITERSKLVAFGYASNAVGTINPVEEIVRRAHHHGALAFVDAVHYAPHGPIDVRALDCDFLVCSTYKFFGPHMGVLYGKRCHLERLEPYKVRANSNAIPYRWEWGTLNHELIAGIPACVDYWVDLGRQLDPSLSARRGALLAAYAAIHKHERELMERLVPGLLEIPGLTLYGIRDPRRFDQRCPTVAVRIAGHTPLELATRLGERGIFTWDGNYYALNLTERLGVEQDGGFLRLGPVHYNTVEEIARLLEELRTIVRA